MKKTILVLLTTYFTCLSFGQQSNCVESGIGQLSIGSTCNFTPFNSTNSTDYWNGATGCGATDRDDAWGWFYGTGNNVTITYSPDSEDAILTIFENACSTTMSHTICSNIGGAGIAETIVLPTTLNQVYRVRIQMNGSDNSMYGSICLMDPLLSSGSGTSCLDALTLTPGTQQCGMNTSVGSFPDNASSPTNPCSSSYNDGEFWFEYEGTGSALQLDVSNLTNTYSGIFVLDACPESGLANCIESHTNGWSTSSYSITTPFLNAGQTYYIVIANYASPYSTNFCLNATEVPPPTPCSGDITINSTYYSNTGLTTCGFGDNFTSSDACGSYYLGGDDIVLAYTPTTSECISIDLSNTNSYTGVFILDYCPNQFGATCLASATSSSGNPSISSFNVTAGTTYFIVISTYPSPQCTPFDIEIAACPPPPSNDECSSATLLPVQTVCGYTAGTVEDATPSFQTNGCSGTANNDVWYSFVATSTRARVSLSNIVGSTTDMFHSVYSGNCGSLGSAISCNDANTTNLTGLTIGDTYYVRVYTYGSSDANTSFDICVLEITECGTPNNQDFCVAPALLTQGGAHFSANTSDAYSADQPGNVLSEFCGTLENNSWYQFIADSTTHTFQFINVSGCLYDGGVQAEVYDVTTDINGCCTHFNSMSNCYNPGSTTLGTVIATGLTIGNTYWLMVDGQAGDICDFTVANWSAIGIIPLSNSHLDLTGTSSSDMLNLKWKSDIESNAQTSSYSLFYSNDNKEYNYLTEFEVKEDEVYHFELPIPSGPTYYQIIATNNDGTKRYSNVYFHTISEELWGIQAVYPNPTNGAINLRIKTKNDNSSIELIDFTGKIVANTSIEDNGDQEITVDYSSVPNGFYMLRLTDEQSIYYHTISKQ